MIHFFSYPFLHPLFYFTVIAQSFYFRINIDFLLMKEMPCHKHHYMLYYMMMRLGMERVIFLIKNMSVHVLHLIEEKFSFIFFFILYFHNLFLFIFQNFNVIFSICSITVTLYTCYCVDRIYIYIFYWCHSAQEIKGRRQKRV